MFKRLTAFLLPLVFIWSTSARAQDQAPPTDAPARVQATQPAEPPQPTQEQQQFQQMQQVFQTIIQNMLAKGINPRDFFQQMQNGADPADIQKQLIDQGLIDKQTLDNLQSTMQSVVANRIKLQLDVDDLEWKVLWPLIQKVMSASAALNGTRGGGGMGGFFTVQSPAGADLSKARRALNAAINDPATHSDSFTSLLRQYREARDSVQQELDTARSDLISALTTRQEGALVSMGLIE